MARKKLGDRVVSVGERHGNRFRNRYVLDGKPVLDSFATEAEATEAAAKFRREKEQSEGPTVNGAIDRYFQSKGLPTATEETQSWQIRALLLSALDQPLVRVSPNQVQDCYDRLRGRVSVSTHRMCLNISKTFLRWCVDRRLISKSPAEKVRGVGRANKGKVQLRISEARAWIAVALGLARDGNAAALGCALALFVGLRRGEVERLCARDVDDNGAVLWIDGTKTVNARRAAAIEVPELRDLLVRYATGRQPQGRLLGVSGETLRRVCGEICVAAGVPHVSFQSLRGACSTFALAGGTTAAAVASALGHHSPSVTRAHYFAPGAEQAVQQRTALTVLDGGKRGNDSSLNRSQVEDAPATAENDAGIVTSERV